MSYHQIIREERYTISTLRKQGYGVAQIADYLGRHRSSIYREVDRNHCNDGRYRPSKADTRTVTRRSVSRRNQQLTDEDFVLVEHYLRQDWSPEQVSGHLKRTGELVICHETIYQHIWADKADGGDLYTHLRGSRKRPIEDRPSAVGERSELGHWEIDTVLGKGSKDCVVTIVERKSRFTMIGKLKAKTKDELNARLLKLIKCHRSRFKTITADNGTEFHGYTDIETATGLQFYFATPHHSWERGLNENTNGLIRQYLPKSDSMKSVTQHQCNSIAKKLNSRPRKILEFQTPEECFYGH